MKSHIWSKVSIACGVIGIGLLVGVEPTGVALVPSEAHAIVGRPLTPVSYAGVARRTVRRTAVVGAGVAAARVATLPAGCAYAVGIYNCGAVNYRPVYDGPTVVYVQQ